ncbi:MAG: hypothetical protein A2X13_00650 [Bacteroidetes bacterium GWC2_33_15]|nr:MAG: hypothetical protein A2X10_04460 [Bacteroidetes bacterium GWA2_33_15]OFX51128.1 MAG: hypothetical protein A2X13_00650 [Bacteroidetes bacterium GWC2_33_15]OFX66439.1 MAG: hypothetical protein A2X15_07305 [Bacteroidetes bacterium GWB2_32_14]OFX70336.1 MAG: hypothetical protein A2X14_03540 [Bacteroidetes bacterium GWD2_33_33]HAN17339.1 hypothetical protein [Bacteroidales bacterium]
MKKIFLLLSVVSLFIAGCGPSASEKKEIEQLNTEAAKLDSISEQIDQRKQEIEKSAEELENLVNEL